MSFALLIAVASTLDIQVSDPVMVFSQVLNLSHSSTVLTSTDSEIFCLIVGHYVVICGYDMDTDEFEIRDPASASPSGKITLDALDEARKSYGTDEDILLVALNKFERDTSSVATLSLHCSNKVM
jgi:hypothetical protein